jgi:hypothetical protein
VHCPFYGKPRMLLTQDTTQLVEVTAANLDSSRIGSITPTLTRLGSACSKETTAALRQDAGLQRKAGNPTGRPAINRPLLASRQLAQ